VLTRRLKPVLLKRKGVTLGVWGEAGIGKSHTLRDLLKGLPCHSLSLHSTVQLSILAQRLRKPKKLPSWAEQTLARLKKNESVEEANVLAALGATLAGLAPFVLHLEDIHEVDSERLEFLRAFARMIGHTKGVGLVVTSRTVPPEPFTAIRLEPLSRGDADTLLEHEVGARLPEQALEWIYGKASGNPLYTLEYLRFLSRQGFLWNDGKSWHWRRPETNLMPVTVEALIELTLSRVQDEKLLTLSQAKAFLPLDADDKLLQEVADLSASDLAEATLELAQRGIFSRGQFAHPLYREVTLKHLSRPKREGLARRALEVLHDNPVQAANFVADAQLQNAKALELLQRAARVAQETNNKAQAGRLLAQASDYTTGEEKGHLALEAAQLLDGVDYTRMLELAVVASSHLSDPSEALFLQANVLALQNKYEAMQAVLGRMPEATKQGRAWLERYIKLLHHAGKHEERLQVWEAHPERDECNSTTAYQVGWAYVHQGKFDAASNLVRQWLAKAQLSEDDKMSLGELQAAIAFYQGNYAEAEKAYSDVLNLRHKDTPPQAIANMLRNRSMARLGLGLYPESLPDLQEALNIYSEVGNSIYYAQTLVMTSYIYQELGDFDKTEQVLLEALEIYRRAEAQAGLVETLAQLSSLYLERPPQPTHPLLAAKYASEAVAIASELRQDFLDIIAAHALSRAKTATGRAAEGLELAEKALEQATTSGFFEAVLSCTHAKGLAHQSLGQVSEAREAFETAWRLAQEHGLPLEINKYGLELDRPNNDVKRARERMQWFEERGLFNGANLAKRYFPELAEQPESVTTKDVPRLEVLGTMQLQHAGQSAKVQGRKRQELFALLLEARMAGRSEVSRLDLFDRLYPDMDEAKALGSLKQLVYTLRLELGEGVIKTTSNGYALGEMTSDAETFLQTPDTSLWRGCYLELALETQAGVADSLYLLLFDKAQALLDTDSKEAARVGRILLEADPFNADYLAFTLRALRQSDNHRTLRRIYEEAKKHFAEVGETLPHSWLAFVETRMTA
jgi:tetratricopeptide (TPR) repeat protein